MIPFSTRRVIEAALAEDLELGDVTSEALVPATRDCRAVVVAREPLVVCGTRIAAEVFWRLDPDLNIEIAAADGTTTAAAQPVLYVGRAGTADPGRRAHRAQSAATPVRDRDRHSRLRGAGGRV